MLHSSMMNGYELLDFVQKYNKDLIVFKKKFRKFKSVAVSLYIS